MKRLLTSVAMLLLAVRSTQADLFLLIDSIPGSSEVPGRKDWIEISGFGIGVRAADDEGQPIPPRPTPLRIESAASTSSPHIFAGIVSATEFDEVRLDVTQSFPTPVVLAYWRLTNARIISYETLAEAPSTIIEHFDIAPQGSVTYGFNQLDEFGAVTGNVEFTWNLITSATSTVTTGTVTGFQFLSGDVDISNLAPVFISPTLPGDFNNNGAVDAADYAVWRNGLGTVYTEADDKVWRANFGETTGAGLGSASSTRGPAAPEPASLALMLLAAVCSSFILRDSPAAIS